MRLCRVRGARHYSGSMKAALAIVAAIVAAIVLSQLLFDFHDWNRQQSCATGGGRNCGQLRTPLNGR